MNEKELKKIVDLTESLDWGIIYENGEFSFSKYSPAGQDFNMYITADTLEELSEEMNEYYNDFDCSQEAYMWLDYSGHGTNGAPYEMKDVYEDMEACQEMIRELAGAIQNLAV